MPSENLKKNNPWSNALYKARSRCRNKTDNAFKYYGGRGIKCFLTHGDMEFLWDRDKAWNLSHPTIDRINNDGDYEVGNCRYIERSENTRRVNGDRKVCLRGHRDWSETKPGWRECRTCKSEAGSRRYARAKKLALEMGVSTNSLWAKSVYFDALARLRSVREVK